jgi:integrase/recombinase XerD
LGEQFKQRGRFTRFVNQHMKSLAKTVGITEKISTYYARHSFSTQVIRSNNSIEFVQAALGHTSSATTRTYFAGFESAKVKDVNQALLKQLNGKKKPTKKSK